MYVDMWPGCWLWSGAIEQEQRTGDGSCSAYHCARRSAINYLGIGRYLSGMRIAASGLMDPMGRRGMVGVSELLGVWSSSRLPSLPSILGRRWCWRVSSALTDALLFQG